MPDWTQIADTVAVGENSGATFFVDDVEVALFQTDGEWLAIEGRCPHKGASLGNGSVENAVVTCPWHDWKFDLRNGDAVGRSGSGVRTIPVRVDGTSVLIDRDALVAPAAAANTVDDGIHRYVIRYGALGWVGLFGTVDRIACSHRDRVVLQTHRGLELGEMLSDPTDDRSATADAQPAGEVVRLAEVAEIDVHSKRQNGQVNRLIADAQQQLDQRELPISVVDGEVLFDAESAVLYFVGESHPDAGPLVTDIAREHDLERIELQPMVDPPPDTGGGCGKPGCGGGGGGCHS